MASHKAQTIFLNSHSSGAKVYKNIVFDLGGVLLTWSPRDMIASVWRETQGGKAPPQGLEAFTSSEVWGKLDEGTITPEEALRDLPSQFNKDDVTTFMHNLQPYFTELPEGIKILQEVRAKGYKTFVLSNFHKTYFDGVQKRYEWFAQFDGLTISSHVLAVKPHAAIYQRLVQDYALDPNETIFIDDKKENVEACPFDAVMCENHVQLRDDLVSLGIL